MSVIKFQAMMTVLLLILLLGVPSTAMAAIQPEENHPSAPSVQSGASPAKPPSASSSEGGKDTDPPSALADSAAPPSPAKDEAPLTEREKEMMALIQSLQERVAKLEAAQAMAGAKPAVAAVPSTGQPPAPAAGKVEAAAGPETTAKESAPLIEQKPVPAVSEAREGDIIVEDTSPKERSKFGTYTPNLGFKLADTEYGDLSLSIYTYVRYLNQLNLDPTYTDAFGNVKNVQQRQDFQIQKLQMKFLGWILSEKFRYFLYAWTSNATMGQKAQVVLAGNINYTFNKYFNLAGGITSLPGTRSVEGNFPFWLGVDTRLIADEFFRPSYTSGIWAKGQITDRLRYQAMLGNNLSILGVSASQLPNYLQTFSGALVWTPIGDNFGPGFGDFENHENAVLRVGTHYTRSRENKQSQPDTESPENTQLRLADGSIIFTPNLFGEGISITDATYQMADLDAGLKYRGISLDGEYFFRRLDDFEGLNTEGLPSLFDHGFQVQASAMVVPRTLQLYVGSSRIFGEYGNPWDVRSGFNWFPWKNKVFRWNAEALYLHKSPVGYSSVPFAVGGTGFVFHTNCELAF